MSDPLYAACTHAERAPVVSIDARGRIDWQRRDRAALRELGPPDALIVALLLQIDALERRLRRLEEELKPC